MEKETKLRQQRKKSDTASKDEPKLRKEKTKEDPKGTETAEDKKIRTWFWLPTRWFPIWLRIIIVLALIGLAAVAGAMIGYGIVGEGGDMYDIFNPETWYHIYDIIYENI